MRKTIQIGDKYKPLMDYYSEQFDREEFNIFITKLLISYKKMKDKNIDLITFSELIEPYDVDIIDLIKLITESAELSDMPPSMEGIMVEPALNSRPNGESVKKPAKSSSKNTQTKVANSQPEKPINPILNLGIDLSQ